MATAMEGVEPTHPPQAQKKEKAKKSVEIRTATIRSPASSYAQLELLSESVEDPPPQLDNLQVRSYCGAALSRFLGDTGSAIPLDVLKVEGNRCWVRVPSQDLAAFAAAMTAWSGTRNGGVSVGFRLLQCSDWLGSMVGRDGQEDLWTS